MNDLVVPTLSTDMQFGTAAYFSLNNEDLIEKEWKKFTQNIKPENYSKEFLELDKWFLKNYMKDVSKKINVVPMFYKNVQRWIYFFYIKDLFYKDKRVFLTLDSINKKIEIGKSFNKILEPNDYKKVEDTILSIQKFFPNLKIEGIGMINILNMYL